MIEARQVGLGTPALLARAVVGVVMIAVGRDQAAVGGGRHGPVDVSHQLGIDVVAGPRRRATIIF